MSVYWRLSNLYFWFFALLGALLPYWSLYLQDEGFSYLQISLLMATIQLTKVIAPNVWGWLGDHTGRRLPLVRMGATVAVVMFLGVFLHPGFWGLMAVMLGFTFFWNAILPLYEVITLSQLESGRTRYGRVRLWGSIGFIATVSGVGALLDWLAVGWLPVLLLGPFLGIVLSTFAISEKPVERHDRAQAGTVWPILRQAPVWSFIVVNVLLQVAHGSYYTFFSIHLAQHGYSKLAIGLLWSLGVLAEVVLFFVMHRLFAWASLRRIALVALVLTTLRWGLIARYTDALPVLLFAQLLHAASYGAMHAMSIQFIHLHFGGVHQGKGQALYGGLSYGLGGAVGAWLSGIMVDWQSTEMAFWGSALATAVGLVIAWLWLRPAQTRAYAY